MRSVKSVVFIGLLLILQSSVFSRLCLFGVGPDLVLVAVVIFAVLNQDEKSTLFAAGTAFLQDLLSYGIYLNLVLKVAYTALINAMKKNFMGSEFFLAAVLLALFTFVTFILTGIIYPLLSGKPIDYPAWLLTVLIAMLYNLVFLPILFPILKKLSHD